MLILRSVISRSSVLSTYVSFKILLFSSFSKRGGGNPYLLCKVCIILCWVACSMRTCILFLLVAPSRWPCLVSHFKSPLYQLGVYLACLDLLHVFLPSFENFSLSLQESFFRFQFHYTMFLVSFSHIFLWMASPSQLRFLLLSLHILSILCPIVPRFKDRLLVSSTPYGQ